MNNQTININQAQKQLANSLNKIAHYHVQKYARTLANGSVPTPKQEQQTAAAVQAAELAGAGQGNLQTAKDANVAANEIKNFMETLWGLNNSNVRNKIKRTKFRTSIQEYINQGKIKKNNVQNILKRFNNANRANNMAAAAAANVNIQNIPTRSNNATTANNAARRPPTNPSGNGTPP